MAPDKNYSSLNELALDLQIFAGERNWQKFHSPKNLAGSVIIEAAELLEHFQWKTQEESRNLGREEKKEVAMEMADVLIYLTRMADLLGIDLLEAASKKIELNKLKYPTDNVQ
jgi:NTP pyrophosphatase (non-canonical NTP hydrolase)